MAFGVTPVDFAQAVDDQFPNFIQWRDQGVDLGAADADVVDTGLGMVATRGEGENANIVTLTASLVVTALGVSFPETVTALDIGPGLTATQDVLGVVTITTDAPAEFSWRHVDGDGEVELTDSSNGISMDASSGAAVLVINPGIVLPGRSVLVVQHGEASVSFTASSGVDLAYRSIFTPAIAGQHGIITLIGQDDGSVLLCGDLATA